MTRALGDIARADTRPTCDDDVARQQRPSPRLDARRVCGGEHGESSRPNARPLWSPPDDTEGDRNGQRAVELDFASLYSIHRRLLLAIAEHKFRVPRADCESLLHDVFMAILQSDATIVDVRAWLIGAMCHRCRRYWRDNQRVQALDPEAAEHIADPRADTDIASLERRLLLARVLPRLRRPDRDVLQLHYLAEMTTPQLATAIGTTPRYASRRISRALRRARDVLR